MTRAGKVWWSSGLAALLIVVVLGWLTYGEFYGGPTRFEGTEGWVELGGKTEPASLADSVIGRDEIHLYESRSQHGNFIECIRSRRRTAAPVDVAFRTITVAHLGNIAMLTGHKLRWDPVTEEILDDPDAARLLSRAMREPWSV